jgi:hypothetical protein
MSITGAVIPQIMTHRHQRIRIVCVAVAIDDVEPLPGVSVEETQPIRGCGRGNGVRHCQRTGAERKERYDTSQQTASIRRQQPITPNRIWRPLYGRRPNFDSTGRMKRGYWQAAGIALAARCLTSSPFLSHRLAEIGGDWAETNRSWIVQPIVDNDPLAGFPCWPKISKASCLLPRPD